MSTQTKDASDMQALVGLLIGLITFIACIVKGCTYIYAAHGLLYAVVATMFFPVAGIVGLLRFLGY